MREHDPSAALLLQALEFNEHFPIDCKCNWKQRQITGDPMAKRATRVDVDFQNLSFKQDGHFMMIPVWVDLRLGDDRPVDFAIGLSARCEIGPKVVERTRLQGQCYYAPMLISTRQLLTSVEVAKAIQPRRHFGPLSSRAAISIHQQLSWSFQKT